MEQVARARVVKRVHVYGHGRIQIPSEVMRDQNIKDGDEVEWVRYAPGTFAVETVNKTGYRSFTP